MTNRELLQAPPEGLTPQDKLRGYILAVESSPIPCPACLTPVDAIAARGLDIDQFHFDSRKPSYRCPHCQAVLDRVTPLVSIGPGWQWQLNQPWLAERLEKARKYDREHAQPG